MTTTPKRMELKAIVHQIIDSDGSVWEEKERGVIANAIAQMTSRIPGTKYDSPKETNDGHKKPENARIAETMMNITIKRFEMLTPTNMNHVGRMSKIWVDPRS